MSQHFDEIHNSAPPECAQTLDTALTVLRALLTAPNVPDTAPPFLMEHPAFAEYFAKVMELRKFVLALAGGDLSVTLTRKGYLAGALKSLQANLRHITWQTQMIAGGDFTQRVEFMGEFSEAFNSMVERLAEARTALEHEIAERERAEVAEREQRQFAEALQQAGQTLGSTLEQNTILDRILDLMRSVVAYDIAYLLLTDGETLTIARTAGEDDPCMFTDEIPLCLLQLPHCPEQQFATDHALRFGSWTGAPILAQESIIGFLVVGSREINSYTAVHSQRLAAFAGQAALALQNARLFREVERMATEDPLTGIINRRHFFTLATAEVARTARLHHPFSCIMLDIDYFKRVNDTYGHQIGDSVLQQTARRCAYQLRPYDILARYGGEEFVVLLPETPADDAFAVAERLRHYIQEQPILVETLSVPITISLGVSTNHTAVPIDSTHAEPLITALINEADRALYASKQGGRNRTTRWDDIVEPVATL